AGLFFGPLGTPPAEEAEFHRSHVCASACLAIRTPPAEEAEFHRSHVCASACLAIRGNLIFGKGRTAKASWSTSPASRTTRLRSPPTSPPANAGRARRSPCGRVRE